MNDIIRLVGVRARGHHGVFAHERADGQDFIVDVSVELDASKASRTDDLAETVHYGVLAEEVAAEIERDPVDLIETLAERIASKVLEHSAAAATEVTVHKPHAPITVPFTDVSVTIRREAQSAERVREDVTRRAVIALGANLGDRDGTLRRAAHAIASLPGVRPVASSHEVESIAMTTHGPDALRPGYRNAVVIVDTALDPEALLRELHRIEDENGRERLERWGDRTLDLDIVAMDDLHLHSDTITLPHPRAAERDFVLAPWVDADPDAVLPGHGLARTLLAALGDTTVGVDEPRLFDDVPRRDCTADEHQA